MKHTIFFHIVMRRIPILALAGMILLLYACRPAASKGGLPVCTVEALRFTENLRPGGWGVDWGVLVDSLTPTLTWEYPDPECNPEKLFLVLEKNWVDLDIPPDSADLVRLPASARSWIPSSPLEPGTTYFWRVQAEVEDRATSGMPGIFRTGPECVVISPGTMLAPELIDPLDRSLLNSRNITLNWEDPTNCIPPGDYKVQISQSATFSSPIEVSNFLPYASLFPPYSTVELSDCTRYYWRVKIDLRDRIDSEDGPWSETWSFTINESGFCAGLPISHITPIPPFDIPLPGGLPPGGGDSSEPSSFIDGHVWHDLCAVPYESTDVAPPGCIWANDIDGYKANGIYESGEPGLAGVTVDLGAGACPSVGLATAITRSDGHYSFGPLAAGTYCVSINALSDANISVLIPGTWTYPIRFAEPAMQTITLGAGEVQSDKNFGWDFQFLPSPGSAAPVAKLLRTANCRRGPSVDYDIVTSLQQGLSVQIIGRNAEFSWWQVQVPGTETLCWIAGENAQTSGDTGKIPVVEADPLGCWVWTGNQNECKVPCPEGAQPGGACEP